MGDRPSTRDLMFALFDTINGNDLDDELGGWWGSSYLGDDVWRVSFDAAAEPDPVEVAAWEVTIKVKPVQ